MASTKLALTLSASTEWEGWFDLVVTHARGEGIWEFINPDKPQISLPTKPQHPTKALVRRLLIAEATPASSDSTQTIPATAPRPSGSSSRASRRRNTRVQNAEGDEEDTPTPTTTPRYEPSAEEVDDRLWFERTEYQDASRMYNKQKAALDLMPLIIKNSVNPKYQTYIEGDLTPHEMLIILKEKIAPDNATIEFELRNQHQSLQKPPKGPLDAWVDKWDVFYRKALKLNMPEAATPNPHRAFLNAIQNVLPGFYVIYNDKIEVQVQENDVMEFPKLLNRFRHARRQHSAKQGGKTTGGRGAFGTTFQGEDLGDKEEKTSDTEQKQQKDEKPKRQRKVPRCLCGEVHWYKECPYVVPSLRTKDWTPDPTIKTKFDNATEGQKVAFKRAIREVAERLEKKAPEDNQQDDKKVQRKASFMATSVPASFGVSRESVYSLTYSFLLDSAATHHVVNDRERFQTFQPTHEPDLVICGTQAVEIEGYGTAIAYGEGPTGEVEIHLRDAVYIPLFHTNLISFRRLIKGGITWNTDNNTLYRHGSEFCKVIDVEDQFVIEHRKVSDIENQHAAFATSTEGSKQHKPSRMPKKSEATGEVWHRRMGHAGPEPIRHLSTHTQGAVVKGEGPLTIDCEACCLSKSHQLISRRPPEHPATEPFERVHFDIVEQSEGYNNHNYMHHLFDEYTKLHFVETTVHNHHGASLDLVKGWYHTIRDTYKYRIKIIRLDNERSLQTQFETWCRGRNPPIKIERTPPYTKEPNGAAERSGGVIDQMARTLRIQGRLPENLWPEIVKDVADLLNTLPTEALRWKTPYEFVNEHRKKMNPENTALQDQNFKPNIAHRKALGCRAYVHLPKELRGKGKLQARAKIGYLVGHDSTNIFRIWYPKKNEVIRTRDVVFNENVFWDPNKPDLTDILVSVAPETGEVVESPQPDGTSSRITEISEVDEEEQAPEAPPDQQRSTNDQQTSQKPSNPQLPTPETTPKPSLPSTASTRLQAHFAGLSDVHNESGFHAAFSTALYTAKKARLHRDQLPSPPKTWRDVHKHTYKAEFIQAAQQEYKTLQKMDAFTEVDKPVNKRVLPLTWVFTYKFDTDGYLTKFKARICVRGDLQQPSKEDNYAATLAAKTLRLLCGIVAAFDLEATQFDAVNAFIHSPLEEEIYVQYPDGFTASGRCLRLRKALYGLRQSPKLWLQYLSKFLTSQGLKRVDDEACLFVSPWLVVFFYVDDIVAIYDKQHFNKFQEFVTALKAQIDIKELGEMKWFLGIRITRDRSRHKLWLCQDSYVENMVQKYHLLPAIAYETPLPVEDLNKYVRTEQATANEIYGYQQRVGSIQFAACSTRPDVAKPASKLAEFQQNPAPEHRRLADRVIQYLYHTKFVGITYSGTLHSPTCLAYSDASLGDDPNTRKSSQGYLVTLFGGAIDWKAGKQKSVATSTTEAELHALQYAARETYWLHRIFKAIDFNPDSDPEVRCDNMQTLRLLQSQVPILNTRLKHVDIAHHWLRQEVQAGRLHVSWIPTSLQAADGLTKLLPRQKHQEFVRQLGLEAVPQEFIQN